MKIKAVIIGFNNRLILTVVSPMNYVSRQCIGGEFFFTHFELVALLVKNGGGGGRCSHVASLGIFFPLPESISGFVNQNLRRLIRVYIFHSSATLYRAHWKTKPEIKRLLS